MILQMFLNGVCLSDFGFRFPLVSVETLNTRFEHFFCIETLLSTDTYLDIVE